MKEATNHHQNSNSSIADDVATIDAINSPTKEEEESVAIDLQQQQDHQLAEYEKLRLRNIQRNTELVALGLLQHNHNTVDDTNTLVSKQRRKEAAVAAPTRRSTRSCKMLLPTGAEEEAATVSNAL